MLRVELQGYFPVDGCKFREHCHCKTDDQQLAIVKATKFVLDELKNYHKVVIFTSVVVASVDDRHRGYPGEGIISGSMQEFAEEARAMKEKFPSNDFFKEKAVEHHAAQQEQKGSQDEDPPPRTGHQVSQEEQATQKVRHDPFTESQ